MDRRIVLDGQAHIDLVDHMGSDQRVIEAARVSYAGDGKDRPPEDDMRLIRYLLKNRHTSPFEHVKFTFHVKAPLFVARQWMRHRTWAYNEISARYTETEEDYYIPEYWRGQSNENKQMSDGVIDDEMLSVYYLDSCAGAFDSYHELMEAGVSREMARMVLPVSTFTRFYASVDLHNLLHFISLRDHDHAQREIRDYAVAMRNMIRPIVPWTMQAWEELNGLD